MISQVNLIRLGAFLTVGASLSVGATSLAAQAQAAPAATTFAPGPAASNPATIPGATTVPVGGDGDAPALRIRSEEVLRSFEPPANEEYTLGQGDDITLQFPGRPELEKDSKQTVGPDGQITLTLAGSIPVAGLTRKAAAEAIKSALATYYTDLTVTVKIDKYSSNRVRVLGYVQHPGEIPFEGTPTLLDAISRAGLIAPSTTGKDGVVTAAGNGIPELCTIYRGGTTAVQVELRTMLMSGNSLADMRLKRNDIVYVPEPRETFVSVIGEVGHPGTIPLTPASTLTSVLSQAGGLTEGAGNSPNIRIIQPSLGKEMIVPYKQLMTAAGQQEFKLHPGDVVVISKTGFYKATYILQRISPIATMVSLAALVGAG